MDVKNPSTVTLKPLVVDYAAIPHVITMDLPFHIRHSSLICYKKLQSDRLYCTVVEVGRYKGASASQPTNWLFLRIWKAIIPHVKEGN